MAQQTIPDEPAFPEVNHANPKFSQPTYGLSKREWFAAMAMQAIASKTSVSSLEDKDFVVEHAVGYADKIIEQLNK